MRALRFLLVAPSEKSTGEAITLLHMAEELEREGAACVFVAGEEMCRHIEPRLHCQVVGLTESLEENRRRWQHALATARPDAIVFADYPLLFFSSGTLPLADEAWVEGIDRPGPALFTLDHLGYAQNQSIVTFGPPHITFAVELTTRLPDRMQVLLPCPNHDPVAASGLTGTAFRCWDPKLYTPQERTQLRSRFLRTADEMLILYSTPAWAAKLAEDLDLPHYRYVTAILGDALEGIDRLVVLVSINCDAAADVASDGNFRAVNLPPMPVDALERLIDAADLVLTDNAVSAMLGKAVCAEKSCAVLVNSFTLAELYERRTERGARTALAMERERVGAVFPWEVFPIWDRRDLTKLGIDQNQLFQRSHARVEAFACETARSTLDDLLNDTGIASDIARNRRNYARQVSDLPSPHQVLVEALA